MNAKSFPFFTLRRALRLLAYALLGVLLILLLAVYSLYLSAQRAPDFYKNLLEVTPEARQSRARSAGEKVRRVENELDHVGRAWQIELTLDELNGYLAVESEKDASPLNIDGFQTPQLGLEGNRVQLAARLDQGAFAGYLHLSMEVALPEPNRLVLKIHRSWLGKLSLSREKAAQQIDQALREGGLQTTLDTEAEIPTITLDLDLKYEGKLEIVLESLEIENETIKLGGTTRLLSR